MSEAGFIQVSVRIRPFIPRDAAVHGRPCVSVEQNRLMIGLPEDDKKTFNFDNIWHPQSKDSSIIEDQRSFFDETIAPMVETFEEGYDCAVFTYGHSTTGNTHTIIGAYPHIGMVPIFADYMYGRVGGFENDKKTRLGFSLVEILNEQLVDLMNADNPRNIVKARLQKNGCVMEGLTEVSVINMQDFAERLSAGLQKRSIGATAINQASSRAHTVAIFTLYTSTMRGGRNYEQVSKFSFFDIAGRQRAENSGLKGDRLKEASKINLSHSTLQTVVDFLSGSRKGVRKVSDGSQLIPYRESILTQLLKEALGGKCKAHMIACISPCHIDMDDTLNTLKFAEKIKKVINVPIYNEFHLDTTFDPARFERDWDALRYTRDADEDQSHSYWASIGAAPPATPRRGGPARRSTTAGDVSYRDDISEHSVTSSLRSSRLSHRGTGKQNLTAPRTQPQPSKIPGVSSTQKSRKSVAGEGDASGLISPRRRTLVFSPTKRVVSTEHRDAATDSIYPPEASLDLAVTHDDIGEHEPHADNCVGTEAMDPSNDPKIAKGIDFEVQTDFEEMQPIATKRAWTLPQTVTVDEHESKKDETDTTGADALKDESLSEANDQAKVAEAKVDSAQPVQTPRTRTVEHIIVGIPYLMPVQGLPIPDQSRPMMRSQSARTSYTPAIHHPIQHAYIGAPIPHQFVQQNARQYPGLPVTHTLEPVPGIPIIPGHSANPVGHQIVYSQPFQDGWH
eukprot:TRINITY_DN419_c1_g1_i1.p1 TRINITY_DN419_c1_g1~~TRINITY_DN419_c1_g1_i1.p1  ORF type:complete len:734 (-),score=113.05 TRINITY_DN419_c1_g1_i1:691-2892(-)